MVRVKFRYLVINLLYPEPPPKTKSPLPHLIQIHSPTPDALHAGILVRLVRDGVQHLYGDYGLGMVQAGLKVVYYSPSTSTAIIRCPRDHYNMVWAALTFVTHLPKPIDTPVVVRVLRVSGTIVKAEEDVIRRSRDIIRRAKEWELNGGLPMLQSLHKAVDADQRSEFHVLAHFDEGAESDAMGG